MGSENRQQETSFPSSSHALLAVAGWSRGKEKKKNNFFAASSQSHTEITRNNPLYMNCQLPGRSDCLLLLLLNGCLAKMDGSEELALFKSFLEKSDIKRSFRNGVGSGIKKTSFRRTKL
ncbi:LOW QUALITY PROTEIN: neuropeptide S [Candoia aspera]|uniref:LOW QUALITY PROTEIN: neuropeptide S n=1 Tax=Candoia aspera TaxID=51853 RepID=UPI002FD83E4C